MCPLSLVRRLGSWVNRSIHRRLIVWSTLFWLVSVSILGLTFLQAGQAQTLDDTRQRNVQLASVISRDVNAQIGSILSDIRIFARRLELLSPDLQSQASAMVDWRLSAPQRHRAVYYFKDGGDLVLYLTDSLENLLALRNTREIVSRPAVRPDDEVLATFQTASAEGAYLSDVHFTGLDRIPVFYVATRISPAADGAGVIVLEIDLRDIWQRIGLSMVGETGFAYAVSKNGVVIAHPDPAYLGRHVATEIAPLAAGFEGSATYVEPLARKKVLSAYSPVGGSTGWGIVVQEDEAEVNSAVLRSGILLIAVWATLAMVGTVGILVMVGRFTRPIVELTKTTEGIARTGALTKTTMAQRHDEIGQLSQAFDQMIDRLQTTEGRLATTAAEERNRLARDLHDAVSQTLFSASLIAEVLPKLWDRNQDEGRRRLEEVRQLTRGALAEMRTLLLELRPASLLEAELGDLLRQLAESVTGRSRVPVTVSVEGQVVLPNDVKVAVYRIAQEALNNIAKHAGASAAKVMLTCAADQVRLTVTDDGKGFDPTRVAPDSLGVGIMRERAADIGATLTIDSALGAGTRIEAIWRNGATRDRP